jgi:protein farnesyltransferase subunit beta
MNQCTTLQDQNKTWDTIEPLLSSSKLELNSKHIKYLLSGLLKPLPKSFVGLDASGPWVMYWILHSMELLSVPLSDMIRYAAMERLLSFQSSTGGFGGGVRQEPHLATTYASVHALAILGIEDGFKRILTKELYNWILSLKQSDGSFIMHRDGEVDIRASYCVLSVASLLGILTDELSNDMEHFIKSCQTYEGGLSGLPMNEAHGGYTYCGVAALILLKKSLNDIDLKSLIYWTTSRQMELEGGCQGRTVIYHFYYF